jgi:hypothetical protein
VVKGLEQHILGTGSRSAYSTSRVVKRVVNKFRTEYSTSRVVKGDVNGWKVCSTLKGCQGISDDRVQNIIVNLKGCQESGERVQNSIFNI